MIQLQEEPIDIAKVEQSVQAPHCGAVLVFVGRTRDHFEGKKVIELRYEAYAPMAIKELEKIQRYIQEEWSQAKVAMVHRLGVVGINEASVVIAVSTPHRDACYEASRYAIEQLKKTVPIWKQEIYEDGSQWKANQ